MKKAKLFSLLFFTIFFNYGIYAQSDVSLETNVDFVSRYVWRGLNIGDAPSAQPSITLSASGFSFGVWGAYGLSNNATATDEIDIWASYAHEFENSMSLSFIVTDYTFPNSGVKFFNFNNYDNADGHGGHTLEAGASLAFCEKLPLTLSAYYNFYNDAGSNSYFQIDYSTNIKEVSLDLFCGASPGSEDNPGCYGTDKFNVINIGAKVSKEVKVTEDFSLPVFVSYIINPRTEISYLVLGISL